MKKILMLFFALAAFVSVSNAQIVRSESRRTVTQERVKEPSESMWYARFGLNMMKAAGDDVDKCDSKLGYQLVWGFEKPMGPLFWGMEFGLGSRGWKFDENGSKQELIAHNGVFSPFNIGYKHPISDDFAVEAHLGAYVSGDYYGKIKDDYHGDFNIYDSDSYVFPDAGLQFGFGVWYNVVGLDIFFQKGMINWQEDIKEHTSNFMIRLGVKF